MSKPIGPDEMDYIAALTLTRTAIGLLNEAKELLARHGVEPDEETDLFSAVLEARGSERAIGDLVACRGDLDLWRGWGTEHQTNAEARESLKKARL